MNAASGSVRSAALLPNTFARHRFHAVDAAAEIDAVEVELENLGFGQAALDHQREDHLLELAAELPLVGEEDGARELLGERAGAFFDAAARAGRGTDRAADADGIDAGMGIEAVIFDGDHRVLQVRCDAGERHVEAVLFEREPGLAVGAVEVGLADPARELVDRHGVARHPDGDDNRDEPESDEDAPQQVLSWGSGATH